MSGVELQFQSNAKSTERELEALNNRLRSIFSTANTSKSVFPDLTPSINKNTRALGAFTKELDKTSSNFTKNFRIIGESIQTLGLLREALTTAASPLTSFKRAGDDVLNLNSRLQIAAKSTEDFVQSQKDVRDIARNTKSAIDATGTAYTGLALVLADKNLDKPVLSRFTESITKAAKLGGGAQASIDAALFQLRQGLGADALRGEELNSILEQTPYLAKVLSKGMGLSIAEMRKAAAEGKLSSEVVIDAISNMTEQIDSDFEKLAITSEVGIGRFKGALSNLAGEVNVAFGISNKSGLFFSNIADSIEKSTPRLIERIAQFQEYLKQGFTAIKVKVPLVIDFGKDLTADAAELLKDTFQRVSDLASSSLPKALSTVRDFRDKVIEYFFDIYDEVIGHSWWPDTIDGVIDRTSDLDGVISKIKSFSKKIIGSFKDIFDNVSFESIGKTLTNIVEKLDIRDSIAKLGEKFAVGILAAMAVGASSSVIKFAGLLLSAGLLEGPLTAASELFGASLFSGIGKAAEDVGVLVARGLMDGVSAAFAIIPELTSGFVTDLLPIPDAITKAFMSLTPLGSSVVSTLVAASAAAAVLSEDFRKLAGATIFGKAGKKGKPAEEGLIALLPANNASDIVAKLFPTSLQKKTAAIGAAILGTAMLDSVNILQAAIPATPFLLHALIGGDAGARIFQDVQTFGFAVAKRFSNALLSAIGADTLVDSLFGKASSSQALAKMKVAMTKFSQMSANTMTNFRSNADAYGSGQIGLMDALRTPGDLKALGVKGLADFDTDAIKTKIQGALSSAKQSISSFVAGIGATLAPLFTSIVNIAKGLGRLITPASFGVTLALFSSFANASAETDTRVHNLAQEVLSFATAMFTLGGAFAVVTRYYREFVAVEGVYQGMEALKKLALADIAKVQTMYSNVKKSATNAAEGISGLFSADGLKKGFTALTKLLGTLSWKIKAAAAVVVVAPFLLEAIFGTDQQIKKKAAAIYDSVRGLLGMQPVTQAGREEAIISGASGLKIGGSDSVYADKVRRVDLKGIEDGQFRRLRTSLEGLYGELETLERSKLEQGYLSEQQIRTQTKHLETINRLLGKQIQIIGVNLESAVVLPKDPNYGSFFDSLIFSFDEMDARIVGLSYVLDENTQRFHKVNGALGEVADWWNSQGFVSRTLNKVFESMKNVAMQVVGAFSAVVKSVLEFPSVLAKWGREQALREGGTMDALFGTATIQAPTSGETEAVNVLNDATALFDKVGARLQKDDQTKVADLLTKQRSNLQEYQDANKSNVFGVNDVKEVQGLYDALRVSTEALQRFGIKTLNAGLQAEMAADSFKEYDKTRELSASMINVELPPKIFDTEVRGIFEDFGKLLKAVKIQEQELGARKPTKDNIEGILAERASLEANKSFLKNSISILKTQFEDPENIGQRLDRLQASPAQTIPKAFIDSLKQLPEAQVEPIVQSGERVLVSTIRSKTLESLKETFGALDESLLQKRASLTKQLSETESSKQFKLQQVDPARPVSNEALLDAQAQAVSSARDMRLQLEDLNDTLKISEEVFNGSAKAGERLQSASIELSDKLEGVRSSPEMRAQAFQSISEKSSTKLEAFMDQTTLDKLTNTLLIQSAQLDVSKKVQGRDVSEEEYGIKALSDMFKALKEDALLSAASVGKLGEVLDSLGESYNAGDLANPTAFLRKRQLLSDSKQGNDAERVAAMNAKEASDLQFTPNIDTRGLDLKAFSDYMTAGKEVARADLLIKQALDANREEDLKAAYDLKKYNETRLAGIERQLLSTSFSEQASLLDSLDVTAAGWDKIDTANVVKLRVEMQSLEDMKSEFSSQPFDMEKYLGLKRAEAGVGRLKKTIEESLMKQSDRSELISQTFKGLSPQVLQNYSKTDFADLTKSGGKLSSISDKVKTNGITPNLADILDFQEIEKNTPRYQAALQKAITDSLRSADFSEFSSRVDDALFEGASALQGLDLSSLVVDIEKIKANVKDGSITPAQGDNAQLQRLSEDLSKQDLLGKDIELFSRRTKANLPLITNATKNLLTDTETARYKALFDGMKAASDKASSTTIPAAKAIAQNDYDMLQAALEDGIRQSSQSLGRLSMEAGFRFRDNVYASFREGLSGLMKSDMSIKETVNMVLDRITGGIIDSFVDGLVSAVEKTDFSNLLVSIGKGQFDIGSLFGGSEFATQQAAGVTLQTAGISLNTAATMLQAAATALSGTQMMGGAGSLLGGSVGDTISGFLDGKSAGAPIDMRDSFTKTSTDFITPTFETATSAAADMFDTASMGFKGVTDTAAQTFGTSGPLPGLFEGAFGQGGMLGDIFGSISGFFSGSGGGGAMMDGLMTAGRGIMSFFGFAEGGLPGELGPGLISGPGTGTSDSILARVSNKEFIVNAKATAKNRQLLEAINSGRVPKFAEGGFVGDSKAVSSDFAAVGVGNTGSTVNIDLGVTGDISKQTRAEIMKMLPELAQGISMYNKERNTKRK